MSGRTDGDPAATVADVVAGAGDVVALTGAGVSVASGIPPFRGETPDETGEAVWDEYDPMTFHRRRFDADPAGFWDDRLDLRERLYGDGVEPNGAHEALARMERRGDLDTLVTQNVDGLHAAAGSEDVVRLHGRRDRVVCDDCGDDRPAGPVFERAREGDGAPACDCGGVLKPAVVLFGEQLPADPLDRAQRRARDCDAFLAVGSSLGVRPASLLPRIAAESGATLVVVNLEKTPLSDVADHDIRADVTELLPAVADR